MKNTSYLQKYPDDIREVPRATIATLDKGEIHKYINALKNGKPNLSMMSNDEIYELMSITRNGKVTLSAVLMFSPYPQAYFPQLCITAISIPGTEIGMTGDSGERFLDNQRIEGNISDMLNEALHFVKRNMKTITIINPKTGEREDRTDYPITAVREAVLNALVHRDYSIHTEGMPIQLNIYENRLEISSPGGIYGRINVDQLGKVQSDTRNPVLATGLEILRITENRYSGIPTIQREMKQYNLPPAQFNDNRGCFIVKLYKNEIATAKDTPLRDDQQRLIAFCQTPRTRHEISKFLGLTSITYAIQTHVMPLVQAGKIHLSIPEKPTSSKQLYYSDNKST